MTKTVLALILLTLPAAFLMAAPAQAFPAESPDSYYARHMKSCEIHGQKRQSLADLFASTRKHEYDQCCVDSVRKMAERGGKRIALGKQCPKGQIKGRLECATSKHWCEGE